MPRIVLIAALLGLLAGCSDEAEPTAPPITPGSPAPTWLTSAGGPTSGPSGSGPVVVDDPPGTITCGLLADAVQRGSLMDPGVVDAVASASSTADAPVADAAARLATAYTAALAARGTDTEPDAVAAVSAAAADMSGVCDDSGLRSAG